MSFEKGILNIIIQYCVDDRFSFDDLVTTCSTFSKKREYLFQAKFSLWGCNIQESLTVDRLVVQQKSAPNLILHDADVKMNHKERLETVNISGKFLSFIYFANQHSVCTKLRDDVHLQEHTSSFLETAQITDVDNPKLHLFGVLQGRMIKLRDMNPYFYGLQFCPQEWMGNPNDTQTLKLLLEEFDAASNSLIWKNEVNPNFEQQFAWWTKREQRSYQGEMYQILQDGFGSCVK